MIITDQEGRNTPFFIDDYEYYSIATVDFSPIEDPSLTESEIGKYVDKGFLVMPHADGTVYGITWRAYHNNGNDLTGLVPKIYKGKDAEWIPCRYVKVFASNDDNYKTIATTINVDIPL
jgi:hypothetical protein